MIFWYKMRSLGETVKETPNPHSEGKPQTLRLPASLSLSYLSLSSQAYARRYLLGCQDIVKVGLSTPISATFSVVPTCPISILMSSLAEARRTPSCEKLMVLTGHSSLENVLIQASSLASQTLTRASADPVAKYLPHLLNSMQMQLPGCACSTCWISNSGQVMISMHPWPLVKKKRSFAMFQLISFTSNLNCLSALTL